MRQTLEKCLALAVAILMWAVGANAASRVMVNRLDVYEAPDVNSRVIGAYHRGDYPEILYDDAYPMYAVSYNGQKGYVIMEGLHEESYEPSSTEYYEALVEHAKKAIAAGTYGYDEDIIEDVWENDNLEAWEKSVAARPDNNDGPVDNSNHLLLNILMGLFVAASALCAYGSVFEFRWAVKLSCFLLAAELLYFLAAPNPWYFSYFKTLGDGSVVRSMKLSWTMLAFILQTFAVLRLFKTKLYGRKIGLMAIAALCAIVAIGAIRYGAGDLITLILRSTLELILSIIGLIVVGILLFRLDEISLSGGGGSSSSGSSDNSWKKCDNCLFYSGGKCSASGRTTSPSDSCPSFVGNSSPT